jgi:hypothetical protein
VASDEPGEVLRGLVAQYRDLHEGKVPERIYVSADIFQVLQQGNTVTSTGRAYTFDGVTVEPKADQSLPFVLRP